MLLVNSGHERVGELAAEIEQGGVHKQQSRSTSPDATMGDQKDVDLQQQPRSNVVVAAVVAAAVVAADAAVRVGGLLAVADGVAALARVAAAAVLAMHDVET